MVADADSCPVTAPARWEYSFDEDWRFCRGDVTGAQDPAFDDREWRELDVPHDWRIEDLPHATSDDGGATANPSAFAFNTDPSPDGVAPRVIGPFDADADPVPDRLDFTIPGVGRPQFPGGRSQGYTVAGVGWYRKHFRVPDLVPDGHHAAGDAQRVELRFDGVYSNADVWLNGVRLGFHPDGYTSFAYDITAQLDRDGSNVLAVRVDNSGKTSRWYSGSGIYQHTWLTITGPVRIPLWGVRVTTPVADERRAIARVEVQVATVGAPAVASVRTTVLDSDGHPAASHSTPEQTVHTGVTHAYAAELAIPGAALWSPEAPHLYHALTEVLLGDRVVDAVTTTFGIRSLAFTGSAGFLLNGKPYKIRGGNIHHDHGPLGSVAIDRAEERTIEILKAAGFNAIRTSHNPRSPYLLDVCDRLGMLVWNEFSETQYTLWALDSNDFGNYFAEWWQRDLTSMVLRDRNHPSVVIWSLGNELHHDPLNYAARTAELVRSLDTTRPVSLGGINSGPDDQDPWQYVDIGDVHYVTDTTSLHAAHPDKAISRSEDVAINLYDAATFDQEHPWMVGTWVWTAWDHIGESAIGAPAAAATEAQALAFATTADLGGVPYPWFQGFSGDIDLIGQRKPQNYWRAVVYGLSPLEMLVERPAVPGTYQFVLPGGACFGYYDELPSWTWDVPRGQEMTVHVYTSGDSVTLLLDGKPLATRTLTVGDKRVTTFSVPYSPGELTAVAYQNGHQIASRTLATTGGPAAIRLTSDVESLTTSRGDLAHVLAEITDSRGRPVPDAVVKVSFQVDGAGEIIGVGNGNPHNVDSFQRPRRWTWHGQALAVLRPAKLPGAVTVTATAPGLTPATLTWMVTPASSGPRPYPGDR